MASSHEIRFHMNHWAIIRYIHAHTYDTHCYNGGYASYRHDSRFKLQNWDSFHTTAIREWIRALCVYDDQQRVDHVRHWTAQHCTAMHSIADAMSLVGNNMAEGYRATISYAAIFWFSTLTGKAVLIRILNVRYVKHGNIGILMLFHPKPSHTDHDVNCAKSRVTLHHVGIGSVSCGSHIDFIYRTT